MKETQTLITAKAWRDEARATLTKAEALKLKGQEVLHSWAAREAAAQRAATASEDDQAKAWAETLAAGRAIVENEPIAHAELNVARTNLAVATKTALSLNQQHAEAVKVLSDAEKAVSDEAERIIDAHAEETALIIQRHVSDVMLLAGELRHLEPDRLHIPINQMPTKPPSAVVERALQLAAAFEAADDFNTPLDKRQHRPMAGMSRAQLKAELIGEPAPAPAAVLLTPAELRRMAVREGVLVA